MNIKFLLITMFFSTSVYSQNHQKIQSSIFGSPSFDGSMTPSEIVFELFSGKTLNESESLEVEVSVPLVKNNESIGNDLSGLPIDINNLPDEALISVPFYLEANSDVDFYDFIDNMDKALDRLRIDSTNKNNPALNQSNCGGYPLGTTFTYTWNSAQLCRSIKTKYTCQNYNGQNNWYITEQIESVIPYCTIEH